MNRHVAIAAGLAVTGVIAGTLFLVRPADRRTRATYREVADLTPLIATAPVHNARLHDLGYALDELSGHVRSICRADLADGEEVAEAVRRAVTVRGSRVTGVRTGASPPSSDGARILPFTIEVEGSFDAVFECLRRAEAMPYPVRVTSVAMGVIDEAAAARVPRVAATIELDVTYAVAAMEYPQ